MPTPEEIKKICTEYAESVKSEYVSAKLIETLVMGFYHSRLKNDYCIVPKSKMREECDFWRQRLPKNCNLASEVNNNPDTARMWGKIEVLNDLFGKSLFNEEKE